MSRLSDLLQRLSERGIDEDDVLIDVDSVRVVRDENDDDAEEED